jgi:hypothetical protein
MIITTPVNIQMQSTDWIYILGWIDAHNTPHDLPPVILRLRTIIQDELRDKSLSPRFREFPAADDGPWLRGILLPGSSNSNA